MIKFILVTVTMGPMGPEDTTEEPLDLGIPSSFALRLSVGHTFRPKDSDARYEVLAIHWDQVQMGWLPTIKVRWA